MVVNPKMIYASLRWICVLFSVPVGYVVVVLTYRVWLQGTDDIWKAVFVSTKFIKSGLGIYAVAWLCVACTMLYYRWQDHKRWCKKLEDNIPIDDPIVLKTFERVCCRLNIPEVKMPINKNVLIQTPLVLGSIHPQLLLPENDYTEEDLELIFYHELSHYIHRDLWFKSYVVVVMMIHCFNPLTWGLLNRVNIWSECMADVTALEASGNLHNAKYYYNKIMYLIPDILKTENDKFFLASLFKNENTLSKRIDFMKNYRKIKPVNGTLTSFLTVILVFISTSAALASGGLVATLHGTVYQMTEERLDETNEKVVVVSGGMAEYYCNTKILDGNNIQEVSLKEDKILVDNFEQGYDINGVMGSNSRYFGSECFLNPGQIVNVSVIISSEDKDFWIGIISDNEEVRYVRGCEDISHNFKISQKGKYRVFIQNNYAGSTNMDIKGRVLYQ
ncbi:MAG: M56 family metallopeptidase [Eubacterium sp.]|nr:M56 family metallopeptidase [Eubacterium sp.]